VANPNAPAVECDQLHAGLAVIGPPGRHRLYVNKLGFVLAFKYGEPPNLAGVNLGNVQIFLSQGTPAPSAHPAAVSFLVGDGDRLYELHRANGVAIAEPIDDRPYGIRDYAVQDLDGYYLSFGQHLYNTGQPIRIERVDVPVRLEKRLAGLLRDLAEHKRLSVNSTLEVMLLHTNDGVGPHTKSQLRYIQELKKKHGIDYDSHGSYRFEE
jgi:catechol 2,3-dioxygenase-like lactoylglutathione lyase family enzyme